MEKILIISTGGTFNKVYNPISGELAIDKSSKALEDIASKWHCKLEVVNIIGKDSLDITNDDREALLDTIQSTEIEHIIIIHGTDTINITARYLANKVLDKQIILTGSMVPYSINPIEATANLASAYGYLHTLNKNGIYIAINGSIGNYNIIIKDRQKGKFIFHT